MLNFFLLLLLSPRRRGGGSPSTAATLLSNFLKSGFIFDIMVEKCIAVVLMVTVTRGKPPFSPLFLFLPLLCLLFHPHLALSLFCFTLPHPHFLNECLSFHSGFLLFENGVQINPPHSSGSEAPFNMQVGRRPEDEVHTQCSYPQMNMLMLLTCSSSAVS